MSGVGTDESLKHLDKRRLPHPVGTDDAELLATGENIIETVENSFRAEALRHVNSLEDFRADIARTAFETDIALTQVDARTLLEVVERVDAELSFPGARLRLPAHPLLLAAQCVAHAIELGAHCVEAFGAASQIIVEIAFVDESALMVKLDYPSGYAVEEIAVVGNHQKRQALTRQIFLEPFNGGDVEMVRRLVENEKIGTRQNDGRESNPLALSSRKSINPGVGVGEPELCQCAPRIVGQCRLFGRYFGIDKTQAGFYGRSPVGQRRNLLEESYPQPARTDNRTTVGLFEAGDDSEQCGFPRSVAGYDTDLVTFFDTEGDIGKQQAVAVALRKAVDLKTDH